MKFLIAIAALMACSGAWVTEVHLDCTGSAMTWTTSAALDRIEPRSFDEEANTAAIQTGSATGKA